MYVVMFELKDYFESKSLSKKLWTELDMPMILLAIKMVSEFVFKACKNLFLF